MAVPSLWTFTQLAGDQKVLSLSGWQAPFGRPRHGAVLSDGYGLRQTETYYGGFGPPTRNVFGDIHDHISLKGRWMDSQMGPGAAQARVVFVKQMIGDSIPVRIEWGTIWSGTGLMLHLLPERESGAEIGWTLNIAVDTDDSIAPPPVPKTLANPRVALTGLFDQVNSLNGVKLAPPDLVFPSDFFDSIDSIIASISTFTASVLSIANTIDDFETATSSELNRLRGSIGQLKTAFLTLQQASDDASVDFAVGSSSSNSQTTWAKQQNDDAQTQAQVLALLAEMDAEAEIAQRGRTQKTAKAQTGDTWESLSTRHYGTLDKADDLRQANLVRYGTKPRPGRPISVPKG